MDKKGEFGTVLVVVVIAVLLFLGYVYNIATRQCSNNDACGEGRYCGSDFSCHEFPSAVQQSSSLVWPSIIIGISIIMAAVILKGWKFWKRDNAAENKMMHDLSDLEHHH
ncbi:MAG TPA: hypothetical protein VJI46_00035 [Candidatus Nanoarchaeia archaeon]|nr:hypothetical protein [Candidatus Nanoarchaeia archaeon]